MGSSNFGNQLFENLNEGFNSSNNDAQLYNKHINDQLREQNLKNVKPPTHTFETYITNDDQTHQKGHGFIDGKNVFNGAFKGLKTIDVNGKVVDAKIGVPTERYTGSVNLDPGSANFAEINTDHGFHNVRFPTLNQGGVGRYKPSGPNIVVGNNRVDDAAKYESILTHPNTKKALIGKLLELNHYADANKLDKNELLKRMRVKDNDGSQFLADEFEKIIKLSKDGKINDLEVNNQGIVKVELKEDNNNIKKIEEIENENGEKTFSEEIQNTSNKIQSNEPVFTPVVASLGTTALNDAADDFLQSFGASDDGFVALKYPHDAVYGLSGEFGGQDHIIIEQFQYKAPQSNLIAKDKKGQPLSEKTDLYLKPTLQNQRNSVLRKFMGVVKLPIPNNLSLTNGVGWGDGRANPLELAAFMTANSTLNQAITQNEIGGAISNFAGDIGGVIESIGKGALKDSAGQAISAIASQFLLGRAGINVDANQMLARTVGVNINPNLELLFNGPKLRNFSFSFNFAPNDELDASVMRKIQKFFKIGMAPIRNTANLIFLGSPNIFRIRYRTNQSDRIGGLPMHKLCALTACEINFTPDGVYQSYDDSSVGSSPVRTIMNLNFSELTPLFQDDYTGSDTDLFNDLKTDEFNNGVGPFSSIGLEDTGF